MGSGTTKNQLRLEEHRTMQHLSRPAYHQRRTAYARFQPILSCEYFYSISLVFILFAMGTLHISSMGWGNRNLT